MDYCAEFDLDLEFGKINEEFTKSLLTDDTKVEVKTDRMAHITGNIFVEFESRGKPSGISISTAPYYAYVLDNTRVVIFIPTTLLKEKCKGCRIVNGGDNNTSKGYLVKVKDLV